MVHADVPSDRTGDPKPLTILVVDDSARVRYVTSRILRAAGFDVREAATGADALRAATQPPDLIVLDIRLPDVDGFEVCRRLKTDPVTAAIPVLYLSGVYRGVTDRVRGLELGADGYLTKPFEAAELVATVKALLRLRQTEAELQQLRERLRQAEKMEAIGRLAGGIAHDFNNLLMVILGRSDILREFVRPEHPMYRYVNLIREAAGQAATLTRQLLIFSRNEVVNPKVLDLNAVIGTVRPILRRLLGEPIDLVTLPGDGLGRVRADPAQLEQVILNLAVNARDAMPQGGRLMLETQNVEIDASFVRSHPEAGVGAHVRLTVTDTGVGIDRATQARIFEPFFTTKGPGQGTGLGLATVYGIVKQSGGYIVIERARGRRTAFTIDLPRVEAPLSSEERALVSLRPRRGSETVLLVEDEARVRDSAREMLEQHGYRVLEAAHPGEALRIGTQHPDAIHLLLTDVVMPDMSGRHLADRLAAARPEMKILYMSGYTADVVLHHGVLSGGPGFLPKPFTGDLLASKVRELLDADRQG